MPAPMPHTLADQCPDATRVVCSLTYERLDLPREDPSRYVHSTRVLSPSTPLGPMMVHCDSSHCAATEGAAWVPGGGWDLLPVLTEMLDARELQRCGRLECDGHGMSPCSSDIRYELTADYATAWVEPHAN